MRETKKTMLTLSMWWAVAANFCLIEVLVSFGLMKLCLYQISADEVTCEKEKKVGSACAESNGRYCALLLLFFLSFFSRLEWIKKNKILSVCEDDSLWCYFESLISFFCESAASLSADFRFSIRCTSSLQIENTGGKSNKNDAYCTPRQPMSSRNRGILTDSKKNQSARYIASLVKNPSSVKPKGQSRSSQVKGIKPTSVKKSVDFIVNFFFKICVWYHIKRQFDILLL